MAKQSNASNCTGKCNCKCSSTVRLFHTNLNTFRFLFTAPYHSRKYSRFSWGILWKESSPLSVYSGKASLSEWRRPSKEPNNGRPKRHKMHNHQAKLRTEPTTTSGPSSLYRYFVIGIPIPDVEWPFPVHSQLMMDNFLFPLAGEGATQKFRCENDRRVSWLMTPSTPPSITWTVPSPSNNKFCFDIQRISNYLRVWLNKLNKFAMGEEIKNSRSSIARCRQVNGVVAGPTPALNTRPHSRKTRPCRVILSS